MSDDFSKPSDFSIGQANILSTRLTSKLGQYFPNSEPIATHMKTAVDFKETNPNRSRRPIYFRCRPIHALVRRPTLRRFFQGTTPGHWAIEVGEYIWELENQNGVITYHIGIWTNPGDVDGRRLLATEREEIGDTILTDLEIKEAGTGSPQSKCVCVFFSRLLNPYSRSSQKRSESKTGFVERDCSTSQDSLGHLQGFLHRKAV